MFFGILNADKEMSFTTAIPRALAQGVCYVIEIT